MSESDSDCQITSVSKPVEGIYWIATVSYDLSVLIGWNPSMLYERPNVRWIIGQQEVGELGFHHWQFVFALKKHQKLGGVRGLFPIGLNPHLELTRSTAATDYVQKLETRILGTEFEYGT